MILCLNQKCRLAFYMKLIINNIIKINEEKIYGTLSELVNIDFSLIKGEIVIVVAGLPAAGHREHRNKYKEEKDDEGERLEG